MTVEVNLETESVKLPLFPQPELVHLSLYNNHFSLYLASLSN